MKKIQPRTQQAMLNTAWLLVERITKIFSELIVVLILARYLGPNQFGLLSYVTALIGLGSVFAKLGLDDIAVRFLVEDDDQHNSVLATCFLLKIVSGALAYVALVAFAHSSQQQEITLLICILGLTLPIQGMEVLGFSFKASLNSRPLVISNSISLLIGCVVKVVCVITQQPLQIFAWCILLEIIIGFVNLSFAYYFTNHQTRFISTVSVDQIKHLIYASFPILISGIAVTAYMRADQIMIKEMLGSEALGLYSAASKISESWYFVPTIITRSLLPVAVRLKKEDPIAFDRLFKLLFRYLTFISIIALALFSFFSGSLIRFLFGSEYIASGNVLVAHSFGGIFVCMGLGLSLWAVVEGKTGKMMINTGVGAIINITLNFFFIKEFGILGAAISTVIARAFAGVFLNYFIRELQPVFRIQLKALGR
ncbi:membrane protein involved in the export of O-antigen and teichoic acid [Leptolyngbya sp. PCC 7375]|nr:membrane protein involved in the export of O-antigen and teichoic acid [Leptolyngbya sp. PCC 7375]